MTFLIPTPTDAVGPVADTVSRIPIEQLSLGDIRDWERLRDDASTFASPYFSIEFAKAVNRVRPDAEVLVFRDPANRAVAFLPFQQVRPGIAEPIGGRLNDTHGILGTIRPDCDLATSLESCDLKRFRFHAAVDSQLPFQRHQFRQLDSHFMDLADGWKSYWQWARQHSQTLRRHGQKRRGLIRDQGALCFEFDCRDSTVLETLISWKRERYRRSNTFDILSVDWTADLLRAIHATRTPGFQGLLSALWAGSELVAVHFGMLTDDRLHYWFPVYSPRFARYSPGTELLLRVAQQAATVGVSKLDLGYGDDPYKFKFCNGSERLCVGLITNNRLDFQWTQAGDNWRQRLKQIPCKQSVKKWLRKVYPNFESWNFR